MTVDALIAEMSRETTAPREPGGWYDTGTDCILYFLEDVAYVADRVDDWITLFHAEDDGRVVGVQIRWVQRIMKHALITRRCRCASA